MSGPVPGPGPGLGLVELSPYLRLLVAPNPGPMTLEGTNTWLLGDPGRAAPVVLDPGPASPDHLSTVLSSCGGRVAEIVLTHRHDDHSGGAARLAELAGCQVRAPDPSPRFGPAQQRLAPGDRFTAAGVTVTAFATPGHTSDSCSLLVEGEDGISRLATGDTVLGRGTTVIAAPDGDLAAYLESLTALETLVRTYRVAQILPGHGPPVDDPAERLAEYRAHRLQRLAQVRAALAVGDRTSAEVVARVYGDLDEALWPAAEQSVAAQLVYLAGRGDL